MSQQKIYVLGATGFIGTGTVKFLREKGFEVFTEKIDITDLSALREAFKKTKPDVVMNFAAVRLIPNVDWCEDHKLETVSVNVAGAINAMTAAIEVGAYPIMMSSGCVYSGGVDKLFTEEDEPNFFGSFYSRMKGVLEKALKELPVLYLRIRMPISYSSNDKNIINKIISYKKVISIPNSMTLVEDIYPALLHLINTKPYGILNLVNEGYLTNEDILNSYKRVVDPNHQFELITLGELEKDIVKAKRSNCILSMEKAKSLGINMPRIDENRLDEMVGSVFGVTKK